MGGDSLDRGRQFGKGGGARSNGRIIEPSVGGN